MTHNSTTEESSVPQTDTPRTDAFREGDSLLESWEQEWEEAITFARQLEQELFESNAEVERLTRALNSCWHASNTYDGNYTRACDNVMTIVTATLKMDYPEDL